MNRKDYQKWIDDRLADLQHSCYNKTPIMKLVPQSYTVRRNNKNYTEGSICYNNFIISWSYYTRLVTIFNTVTHKYGQAKAAIDDSFCISEGVAIAWAHYNKLSIPSIDKTINREELVSGDKFINSMNSNQILTFIGWLPNTTQGTIGRWAAVLDANDRLLKSQVKDKVDKIS